jgi:hypothetical protein
MERAMPLSELTDRAAVFKAIAEYDHVGREVFLERYGFGRSRGYVLRFDGKDYDSKAIAGAAHGYQFPDRGPLRSVDFSGGEQTVQRKLEELGFEVVSPSDAWSRDEVERIVEDYFDMLMREARGELQQDRAPRAPEGSAQWSFRRFNRVQASEHQRGPERIRAALHPRLQAAEQRAGTTP